MRENASQMQLRTLCELPRETFDVAGRDSQTIHSSVYLQMERDLFAPGNARGRAIERFQLFAPMDDRGEVMLNQTSFFARPKAGEHQRRFSNTGFANLRAF
jgi:hypothetical protein